MNHAITLGGLLLFLACVGGFIAAAFGVLMTFHDGSEMGAPSRQGCIVAVIGAVVFGAALFGLLP